MRINGGKRPFSLATRLTFFISLATIAAFVAFTWIMLYSVEQHFAEQDVSDLKRISATLDAILKNPTEPESQRLEKLHNVLSGYRNIAVYLKNNHNQVLYRSPDSPELDAIAALPQLAEKIASRDVFMWPGALRDTPAHHNANLGQATYRMIAFYVDVAATDNQPAATYTLLIALSIDFHLHYIDELKNNLILVASIISLLIIFIVLFAVYTGHAPLRNVSTKIKNITSDNLGVRLDPNKVPIELEQLVISFNHMIERIEDVFTRQANFSADIAHEIRTPITNLVTQTEIVLSQSRSDKELKEVLYSNLEEFGRMSKMVSDMLFLAQADDHQLIPERAHINLATEVIKVFDFFEAWAEECEVGLKFEGTSANVEGDSLMLRRVINNLLSNAIRYTPRGMTVKVRIDDNDNWVDLVVENPGAPIPEEHLPRLFDRFYRVDPSRQRKGEGSGIGLAIVKSIITAHGGKIAVTSDVIATRFILSLPKCSV